MTPIAWESGLIFRLHEIKYIIAGAAGKGSVLTQRVGDQHHKEFLVEDLARWLVCGDLVIDFCPATPGAKREHQMDAISQEYQDEARARLKLIKPLLKRSRVSTRELKRLVRKHRARGVETSVRTLRRHLTAFRQQGIMGLIPRPGFRRAPEPQFANAAVQQIFDKVIGERYLDEIAPLRTAVLEEVQDECELAGIKAPGTSTLYRQIGRLPKREVSLVREGQIKHDKQFLATPTKYVKRKAVSPLQMVFMDHLRPDIRLKNDEGTATLENPWITIGICGYSGMPWGKHLTFDHPSSSSVRMAYRHGVLPKNVKSQFSTKNEWVAYGIPEEFYVDNGKEFHAKAFEDLCEILGTHVTYRPRKTPRFGGIIERFFGSLQTRIIHNLPGNTKTLKNVKEKSHDPDTRACLTLRQLDEILSIYLTDVYPLLPHKGLNNRTPLEVWNEGLEFIGFPRVPDNIEQFEIDILPTDVRQVTREGIVREHLYYHHPSLDLLVGESVPIKYDSLRLAHIYYFHPIDKKWIETPAADPDAADMTEMEYRLVREQLKVDRLPVDWNTIRHARHRIRQIPQNKKKDRFAKAVDKTKANRALNQAAEDQKQPLQEKPIKMLSWDSVEWIPPAVQGMPDL